MSAHTPGPWRVKGRYYRQQFRAEMVEPNICEMSSSLPPDTVKANARLIAAAPALLEALKGIIAAADDPDNEKDSELVDQIDWAGIRQAIAQAERRLS